MSFYGQREYGQFNSNNFGSNTRRNSDSFSEDTGPKRTKWNRRGNRGRNTRNVDMVSPQPLFKEPQPSPRRSPAQNRNRDNFPRDGPGGSRSYQHFDMNDMPNFVEPQHSGLPWNWDRYTQNCKSWQDRHKLAYYRSRCMALEFENQMMFEQVKSLVEENCIFAAERGVMPTMRLPELSGRREQLEEGEFSNRQPTKKKNQGKDKTTSDSSSDTSDQSSCNDFVDGGSEDVMKFLEETMRHRLTLSKSKEEAEKKKNTDETLKTPESKKEEGPKHPVGLKRKEELDQLYGENSSLIQKLETATQLNFNRNCDTFKPEFWLAIPLNSETVV